MNSQATLQPGAGVFGGARAVFVLGVRNQLAGLRKYGLGAIVLLPILFSAPYAIFVDGDVASFYVEDIVWVFYFKLLLPITAALIGVGALADDRQNLTLSYILVRPVPRTVVFLARYLSGLVVSIAFAWATIVVPFLILLARGGGDFAEVAGPVLLWAMLVSVLALVALNALFTMAGGAFPFPLMFALVYCFFWEGLFSSFSLYGTSRATIASICRRLLYDWSGMGQRTGDDAWLGKFDMTLLFETPGPCLLGLALLAILSLAFGALFFNLATHHNKAT